MTQYLYKRIIHYHLPLLGAVDEPVLEENKCFSVIHGQGGRDVLDLVASTEEERDAWVTGLSHLVQSVKALHEEKQYDV